MRFAIVRLRLTNAATVATEATRQVRVAVIGTPNVGKSSITNKLIRNDLCAVSKVIDTTRQNWVTKLREGPVQLTVVDSPGLIGINHAKKVMHTHSESKIMVDPENAFRSAHHVLVVHDVTALGAFLHHRVLHLLHRNSHIPASLVLNKCDLIAKRPQLLDLVQKLTCGVVDGKPLTVEKPKLGKLGKIIGSSNKDLVLTINPLGELMDGKSDEWKENKVINKATHKCSWQETKSVFQTEVGWPHFRNVFFVSCVSGEGIDTMRKFLIGCAETSDHLVLDDRPGYRQKPNVLIAEHVRSAMLDSVPAYISYNLRPVVTDFEHLGDSINITVDIACEKERWARLVNGVINEQTALLSKRFSKLFDAPVNMNLHTKFKGKLYTGK